MVTTCSGTSQIPELSLTHGGDVGHPLSHNLPRLAEVVGMQQTMLVTGVASRQVPRRDEIEDRWVLLVLFHRIMARWPTAQPVEILMCVLLSWYGDLGGRSADTCFASVANGDSMDGGGIVRPVGDGTHED